MKLRYTKRVQDENNAAIIIQMKSRYCLALIKVSKRKKERKKTTRD